MLYLELVAGGMWSRMEWHADSNSYLTTRTGKATTDMRFCTLRGMGRCKLINHNQLTSILEEGPVRAHIIFIS